MRFYVVLFLLLLFSCKPLSISNTKITCKSGYDCEVNYYQETELIEKNDGLNQLYLSHKENSNYKLVSVNVVASEQPIKAQDMPQIMYFFNFKTSPKSAIKSLNVYKKINCKCPDAGLVQLKNIKVTMVENQQHAYLQLLGDELDLLEGSVLLKLR